MTDIVPIAKNRKEFLDLLLLADEQESMIDRYLERGDMYALYDGGLKAVCVVTDEGNGVYEIKNIATCPQARRQGYGRRLIAFVREHYKERCHTLQVGTGAGTGQVAFYERCGFTCSHRIPRFFTDNYDHPIYEDGRLLEDMVYLRIDTNT